MNNIYSAFGGIIDFSEDSKLGNAGKMTLKAGVKGMLGETDLPINMNGRNDFRDWDKIRSFAEKFADIF